MGENIEQGLSQPVGGRADAVRLRTVQSAALQPAADDPHGSGATRFSGTGRLASRRAAPAKGLALRGAAARGPAASGLVAVCTTFAARLEVLAAGALAARANVFSPAGLSPKARPSPRGRSKFRAPAGCLRREGERSFRPPACRQSSGPRLSGGTPCRQRLRRAGETSWPRRSRPRAACGPAKTFSACLRAVRALP